MKPKKPAAPRFNLPWETEHGSTIIWDSNGHLVAQFASGEMSELQRRRKARYAKFVVDTVNRTIGESKP